ncbi:MAG: hypothetical protein VX278_18305, partial [Myxococcota bacterium]|nr:hypothetical protein [Myxococcota bacterium]
MGSTDTLDLTTTSAMPEDSLVCTASAEDSDGGSASETAGISIANRAPSAPSISLSPAVPIAGEDDLLCSVDADSTDADGNSVTYDYAWSVNGVVNSSYSTDTVSASDITAEEVWVCTVTPTDGIDTGSSASASVTIQSPIGITSCPSSLLASEAQYTFVGENAGDYAGYSVSSAGDVDGDGLGDLIVGAYLNDDAGSYAGKAYLILGASLRHKSINLSQADYSFVGEGDGDRAGYSVSSAGDVDGDGLDDLIIGAHQNADGGSDAGKAYLVFGSSLGSDSTIDLSGADYSFVGENDGDYAGVVVSAAGDVDGDDKADLLIAATHNDDGGTRAGKAYLVLGASLGTSATIDLSGADYSFLGENDNDNAGTSLSSAG